MLLRSNCLLVTLISCFTISHWVEGYQFRYATTFFLMIALCYANVQITFAEFLIFSLFLKTTASPIERVRVLRKQLKCWGGFWLIVKIIPNLLLFLWLTLNDSFSFNVTLLTELVLVLLEVTLQSLMLVTVLVKLTRSLNSAAGEDIPTSSTAEKRALIQAYGEKMEGQTRITYGFSTVLIMISIAFITLVIYFQMTLPYAWVLFAVYVLFWPTIAIGPIFLLKEPVIAMQVESSYAEESMMHAGRRIDQASIIRPTGAMVSKNFHETIT